MTKKIYIQPTTKFFAMENQELLAGSNSMSIGSQGVGGGYSKENNFDDFDEEDSYVEVSSSIED